MIPDLAPGYFSQGISSDGPVLLEDGQPVSIERVIELLNAKYQPPEPEPVEGDLLPAIGEEVLIHLASLDAWVPHTVTGYYAWGDHGGNSSLHRVFVRVVDAAGYPNARLLRDVRRGI